jgi:hypothetical protein
MSATTQTHEAGVAEDEQFEQDFEALQEVLSSFSKVMKVYVNNGRHRQVGIKIEFGDLYTGVLNHQMIKILQEHNFANVPQVSGSEWGHASVYALHDTSEDIDELTLQ